MQSSLLCLALAGCAAQSKLLEAELAQLAGWLPGRYDNLAQAEAERSGSHPLNEALAVAIVPVYAPMLGEYVFYLQETAANDPRRVLGQRLLSFAAVEGRIVQSQWSFAEPLRWRDAHLNTDLFKGLMPQDITRLVGCELTWSKDGERFVGENDPQRCRASAQAGGRAARIETRAELDAETLALRERVLDAEGRLISERSPEPFYRFTKRSN